MKLTYQIREDILLRDFLKQQDISDKLLIEPTSIEILLENIPDNSLTKNKRKLKIMPTIDAKRL